MNFFHDAVEALFVVSYPFYIVLLRQQSERSLDMIMRKLHEDDDQFETVMMALEDIKARQYEILKKAE